MKLRRFGAIAMAAALLVGVFSSCGEKEKSKAGPSIKITDNDRKEIKELAVENFGDPANDKDGLKIFVIPADGVKVTKKLKVTVHAKKPDGTTNTNEKEFNLEKQNDGQYMAIVGLAKSETDKGGIGYAKSNFNEVTSLDFSVTDSNGKEAKKTINVKGAEKPTPGTTPENPGAETAISLTDLGSKYMNHIEAAKDGCEIFGTFDEDFNAVAKADGKGLIQNVSEAKKAFAAKIKIVNDKPYKMGIVEVADFKKLTKEAFDKLNADQKELTLEKGKLVLLKADDGSKYFFIKVEDIKAEKLYDHKAKKEVDPAAEGSKGYMILSVQKNK